MRDLRLFDLFRHLALLCFAVLMAVPAGPLYADDASDSQDDEKEAEKVVVTATRTEQPLAEVPAAVTVIDSDEIQRTPTDDIFSDLLRGVPGVNVARTNGTDVSISTRTATGTIPQGQLAMMDYRTIYQDFNGFVYWASLPVEPEDIERIEVVRGPGSAVWGANAMHGIVHVVTKAPKDMVGTRLKLGGGEMGTVYGNVTHAGVQGRLGYRVSVGYTEQEPFDPPSGTIPGTVGPSNPNGRQYPDYDPALSRRTRANFRLDFDADEQTTWSLSGGYGEGEGGFLSPGGPAIMKDGTIHAFGKLDWTRGPTRVTAFVNRDDAVGQFVRGNFPIETKGDYISNLDVSDTRIVGDRHILTYGGNARYANYADAEPGATLTPNAEDRDSYGLFLQDDMYLTEQLRFVGGARWDWVDPMGSAISPRASLVFTPRPGQQFRVSYNRAVQAPSMLQNYLDFGNVQFVLLPNYDNPAGPPVPFQVFGRSIGNLDLKAKELDAFEIGWNGSVGERLDLSAAAYWNEIRNDFQSQVTMFYSSSNPPPNWPFTNTAVLDDPSTAAGNLIALLEGTNLGETRERGVELGLNLRVNQEIRAWGTWSWQDALEVKDWGEVSLPDGSTEIPLNRAPRNRFGVGGEYDTGRYYLNANANYQSEAFWAEVGTLGKTDAFTLVNLGAGVRFQQERVVVSVNALNLFDDDAQQHLWGDLMQRRVIGQVSYAF